MSGTSESTPQVRTLLLTDLVDSTQLVEKLGDTAAADLFRAHDRIVLDLQQRWRGRLIDRSDGLLLLFQRPIDGLGFALDYVRALRDLGRERRLAQELQARAGLHVGEVLVWENSLDAVRMGAKSLEVEGLAKPLAGRLMALARPGQILLSATAEPLAHRAARELGERGELLVWKSYGRWRFKGLPEAQDVFEVGEPGLAPLRMPSHTPKAWRDLPLWRRPMALATEALLLGGLAVTGWFLTRPQPAIAFNERDWVVVGDLRNLTGDPRLDESLEQAFRISLEQSRYVNVLSDLKVRDTLERMQKKPDTQVDRALGSEIAVRDGARALLLPTVAEVGGRLRVSTEVIDPRTQTTVYAVSADGKGVESALASIDDVTDQLRERLGEALESVEKSSVPLPNVSTPNLDALKAYAIGRHRQYADPDFEAAKALYGQALRLDPDFAMARASLGILQVGMGETGEGLRNMDRAMHQRDDRLSPRERVGLEVLMAQFEPVDVLLKASQHQIDLYPDDLAARYRMGVTGWAFANRYASMMPHARAASAPMSPAQDRARMLEGALLMGGGQLDAARRVFALVTSPVVANYDIGQWSVALAQRRHAEALRLFDAVKAPPGSRRVALRRQFAILVAADRGDWTQARVDAAQALVAADATPSLSEQARARVQQLALRVLAGERPRAADFQAGFEWVTRNEAGLTEAYKVFPTDLRMELAYLAALSGQPDVARQGLGRPPAAVIAWNPMSAQMHRVAMAQIALANGDAKAALDQLAPLRTRDDAIIAVHATLRRAYAALDRTAEVEAESAWLAAHRGRALVERAGSHGLNALDLVSTH